MNMKTAWRCRTVELPPQPPGAAWVMGIINATPDSFSDGGLYVAADAAIQHGRALWAAGADIVDVGGESTRPGAAAVSADEELRRVLPVVSGLVESGVVVSIDTTKPEVMRAAIAAGVHIVNDVSGFVDDDAIAAVADSATKDCGVVVMHRQGDSQTMQHNPRYADVVGEVRAFLHHQAARLEAAGVARERICLDPGIGFGKTLAHNQQLLSALPTIAGGYPLLVGVSRKSMFKNIVADASERDGVSATAAAVLAERGADIVRVHDVAATREALAAAQLVTAAAH